MTILGWMQIYRNAAEYSLKKKDKPCIPGGGAVTRSSTLEILNAVSVDTLKLYANVHVCLLCACSFLWQEEPLLPSDKKRNKSTKIIMIISKEMVLKAN